MFLGLVWLTSDHIFGLRDFWDKSPSQTYDYYEFYNFMLQSACETMEKVFHRKCQMSILLGFLLIVI